MKWNGVCFSVYTLQPRTQSKQLSRLISAAEYGSRSFLFLHKAKIARDVASVTVLPANVVSSWEALLANNQDQLMEGHSLRRAVFPLLRIWMILKVADVHLFTIGRNQNVYI